MRVGINGFGRIGRAILRQSLAGYGDCQIVAINDLSPLPSLVHLLKYDSVHGRLDAIIEEKNGKIIVNGGEIAISSYKDPKDIAWKSQNVDVVMECSGVFRDKKSVSQHLHEQGAEKVIISAPGEGEDQTIVVGVNHDRLLKDHKIISNGSCTTNCLAPVLKVMHENFVIESALMTTVHSYTNDQRILDVWHEDKRRARAAALNMIPTSTGAAKAIGLVIPELKGLVDGLAIRVPTSHVSMIDLTLKVKRETRKEIVNQKLKEASETYPLKGILRVCEEELVSSDFLGDRHSSIVDANMTQVVGGTLIKILSWYDNEIGFACRMLDLASIMEKLGT